MVVDAVTGFLSSIVGMMSDWALSLLPQHVKRRAVGHSAPQEAEQPAVANFVISVPHLGGLTTR